MLMSCGVWIRQRRLFRFNARACLNGWWRLIRPGRRLFVQGPDYDRQVDLSTGMLAGGYLDATLAGFGFSPGPRAEARRIHVLCEGIDRLTILPIIEIQYMWTSRDIEPDC